jgi:monoamine oxidase
VPLNTISTIEFRPQLRPRQKLAVQTGHGGCAIKLWIAASKVPVGILATGGGRGIQWMFAERSAEDATLIVAFALNDGSLDPNSRPDISAALHRFFPEAGLIGWDWHDWSTDPWSRGTWVAVPADAPWIADSAEWHPHHRAVFASSDFSPESPGWFEAAIVAGERAAQTASASIQR